jgi:hypothetical protein
VREYELVAASTIHRLILLCAGMDSKDTCGTLQYMDVI